MEKPKQKKSQFTDELTIPERGKDWQAFSAEKHPKESSIEAILAENSVSNTTKSRFQGHLLLRHYESHTEFRILNATLQFPVFIGRADVNSDYLPELNLGLLDEKQKTVSRRHAVISPYGELLVITDQKSLNGTYLNSQRLIPGQSWILRNGDILRLGKICLIVYFVNENEKSVPFSDTPSHPNR